MMKNIEKIWSKVIRQEISVWGPGAEKNKIIFSMEIHSLQADSTYSSPTFEQRHFDNSDH